MHTINKGFTLIETLIYIALFTLILSGGFAAAYSLIDNSEKLNQRTVTIEESNFVLRKINWVLNGTSDLNVPNSTTLETTKYDGADYEISFDGTDIFITENGGDDIELNTENVNVDFLTFEYIPGGSGSPEGVRAVLSINGIVATTTKYTRK